MDVDDFSDGYDQEEDNYYNDDDDDDDSDHGIRLESTLYSYYFRIILI